MSVLPPPRDLAVGGNADESRAPAEVGNLVAALAAAEAAGHPAEIDAVCAVVREGVVGPPSRLTALGKTLLRLVRMDEAEVLFRQALAEDADAIEALKGLARCLNRRRAWPEALDVWGRLARLHPTWAEPRKQVARLLFRLGRDCDAADMLAQAINDDSLDPASLADLFESGGLDGLAEATLRRNPSTTSRRLVDFLVQRGRIGEAMAIARTFDARSSATRRLTGALFRAGVAERARVTMPGHPVALTMPESLIEALDDLRPPMLCVDPSHATLVTSTLGPGGAERQLVLTAEGVKQQAPDLGLDVVCLSADRHDGRFFLERLQAAGVATRETAPRAEAIVAAEAAGFGYLTPLLALLPPELSRVVAGLIPLLAARRPAIVHGWQDMAGLAAALAADLVGLPPALVATRSLAPDRKFVRNRRYLRPMLRDLALKDRIRLFNNSRAGAEDYARWLDIDSDRIAVLRNGLDTAALQREAQAAPVDRHALGLPGTGPIVGGVLRLTEEKRPSLWVEAAAHIAARHRDASFLLVGDGPLREIVRSAADRPPLRGRMVWLPRRSDVAALYRLMDVAVLTSRIEGLPNVVIEAQALGVPVVAADAGGCREAMAPDRTGTIVADATPAGFADAVCTLLSDPVKRAAFAAAGPAFIERRFGLERMVEETLAAYRVAAQTATGQ